MPLFTGQPSLAPQISQVTAHIYVHGTNTTPWFVVPERSSIVTDERNFDTGIACLSLHSFHVLAVGEDDRIAPGVLILWLVQDDGPSIRDLCLGNDAANMRDIPEAVM